MGVLNGVEHKVPERSDPGGIRILTKRIAIGLDLGRSLTNQEMRRMEPTSDLADEVLDKKACLAKGTQEVCPPCHKLGFDSFPMCRRIAEARASVEESLQRQEQVVNLTANVPLEPSS